MRPTRRAVLGAAAAVTTGLAGCTDSQDGADGENSGGGSSDGDGGSDPSPTGVATTEGTTTDTAPPSDTATSTGETGTPGSNATVRVRSHPNLGEILVGPDGRTLYMFDRDTRGESASACSGGCLEAWPPLTVDGDPTTGDGVEAELTTFERDGGETQVAAGGWPLYYFASDESPGDASGQGVNDVWWVLGPDGTPKRPASTSTSTPASETTVRARSHPDLGEILVGRDGRTLYMFDRDTQGEGASACSGGCLEAWPPLTVRGEPTAGGGVSAELTTFERDGGETQVAAGGWPLYYYADDEEPGDANGQGVGDVWWVVGSDGTPRRPGGTPTASSTSDGGGTY